MRYFWWPEFQKRGALHYHAILIDPPFEFERDARKWFDAHWKTADRRELAEIQTWVEWRSWAWFKSRGGDYVLKDVRKVAGKRYEQDYERMPKGWRTCSNHWLAYTAAAHQEHENKAWTVCTAEASAPYHERRLAIWVERVDWHVPGKGGCVLTGERRRPGRSRRHGRILTRAVYDGTAAVTFSEGAAKGRSLRDGAGDGWSSGGATQEQQQLIAGNNGGQASPELPAGLWDTAGAHRACRPGYQWRAATGAPSLSRTAVGELNSEAGLHEGGRHMTNNRGSL